MMEDVELKAPKPSRILKLETDTRQRQVTIVYKQDGGGPFRVAMLGCGGTSDKNQRMVGDAIGALKPEEQPDAVVLLGDNFYPNGYKESSDLVRNLDEPYQEVDAHFILIDGNHEHGVAYLTAMVSGRFSTVNKLINDMSRNDVSNHDTNKFHMPNDYYIITVTQELEKHPEQVIIALDSNTFPYDRKQQEWFITVLRDVEDSQITIVCHHSVMTYGKRHKQGRKYEDDANKYRKKFTEQVEGTGFWASQNKVFKQAFYHCVRSAKKMPTDISSIFSAHDHYMMVSAGKLANQFTCGGGGGALQKATQLDAGLQKNTVHAYASSFGFAILHCASNSQAVHMYTVNNGNTHLLSKSIISASDNAYSMRTWEYTETDKIKRCVVAQRQLEKGQMVYSFTENSSTREQTVSLNSMLTEAMFNDILQGLEVSVGVDDRPIMNCLLDCLIYIRAVIQDEQFAVLDYERNPLWEYVSRMPWKEIGFHVPTIQQVLKRAYKMIPGRDDGNELKRAVSTALLKLSLISNTHKKTSRNHQNFLLVAMDGLCVLDRVTKYASYPEELIPNKLAQLPDNRSEKSRYIQLEYFKNQLDKCYTCESLVKYFNEVVIFLPNILKENSKELAEALLASLFPIIELFDAKTAEQQYHTVVGLYKKVSKGLLFAWGLQACLHLQWSISINNYSKNVVARYLSLITSSQHGFYAQNNMYIKRVMENMIDELRDFDDVCIPELYKACSIFNLDIEGDKKFTVSKKHMQKIEWLLQNYKGHDKMVEQQEMNHRGDPPSARKNEPAGGLFMN